MNQLDDQVEYNFQEMEGCDHILFPVRNYMAPEEHFDTIAYYCPFCGLTNYWGIEPAARLRMNEIYERQLLSGQLNDKVVTTKLLSEEEISDILGKVAKMRLSSMDEVRDVIRKSADQSVTEKVLQKKK